MEAFQHQLIFTSIILGFALNYYFQGIHKVVIYKKKTIRYSVHSIWVVIGFISLLQFWLATFSLSKNENIMDGNNYLYFITSNLTVVICYYFLAMFLFPSQEQFNAYHSKEKQFDFKKFSLQNGKIFYLLLLIQLIAFTVEDWVATQFCEKDLAYIRFSLFPLYLLGYFFVDKKSRPHLLIAIYTFIVIIYFFIRRAGLLVY